MNPLRTKYHELYMSIAVEASKQSISKRKQVGAAIVTTTGLIAIGFNGMPSGVCNNPELPDGSKNPFVIHAERNAIDKLTRQGVSPVGSILFVTHAPCIECAKSIHATGIIAVYYRNEMNCMEGIKFLEHTGIKIERW